MLDPQQFGAGRDSLPDGAAGSGCALALTPFRAVGIAELFEDEEACFDPAGRGHLHPGSRYKPKMACPGRRARNLTQT